MFKGERFDPYEVAVLREGFEEVVARSGRVSTSEDRALVEGTIIIQACRGVLLDKEELITKVLARIRISGL